MRLRLFGLAFVVPFVLVTLLSTLWALASPVFSVPDENAHALKAIAQLQGQVVGYTVPDVKHIVVDLPPEDAYNGNILCFATHPDVPAECHTELGDPAGQVWFNTWVGAYNPVYYYAVGWPSLFLDGNASIYGMRIASAVLGSLFVAAAFLVAVAGRRRSWLPFGVAFAAAPMNVYLIGSVNPNGLEIASATALWVGVLRLFESFDDRSPAIDGARSVSRSVIWTIVTLSSIALVSARALGPLWLVVVVAAAALVVGWHPVKRLFTTPGSFAWLAVIAATGVFSLVWTAVGGSLSSQAEAGDAPLVGAGPLTGIAYMLRMTPDYLQQAFGWFGWLDTPLPTWMYWLIVAAASVLVVLAATALRRRSTLVFAAIVAAALLVPVAVQARSVAQTGIIWQGRYSIFLYLGVLIVAAWLLSGRDGDRVGYIAPRVTAIGSSLIAGFGVVAFWFVLVRYVIGLDAFPNEMWNDPQWQPPLGWPALLAAYTLVSLAFAAYMTWLSRSVRPDRAGFPEVRSDDVPESVPRQEHADA